MLLHSRFRRSFVASCATCATHGYSSILPGDLDRNQCHVVPLCRFDRTVRPRNRSSEDPVSLRGHEKSVCHDRFGYQQVFFLGLCWDHSHQRLVCFTSFRDGFGVLLFASIDLLQDLKWKHPCLRLKHFRQIGRRLCLSISCCYRFSKLVNINWGREGESCCFMAMCKVTPAFAAGSCRETTFISNLSWLILRNWYLWCSSITFLT